MVLLQALHALAKQQRWKLTVAHFNHQLRGRSSDADEQFVRKAAERLRLPIVVGGADIRSFAKSHRISVEMAARTLRHEFLARTARKTRSSRIALAHHADDQIELFFLRLLRGSGGEGLGGMKWRSPSPSDQGIDVVRPLLDQPKDALQEFAKVNGIRFREDATNASLDIPRNRLRHELLPLLREHYQPALEKTILRTMEIVRAEAEFAAEKAVAWLHQVRGAKETGRGQERPPFESLPVALQRRCIQFQLLEEWIAADFDLVERLRLNPEKPVCIPRRQEIVSVRHSSGLVSLQPIGAKPSFNPGTLTMKLQDRAGKVLFDGLKLRWRLLGKTTSLPRPLLGQEYLDADQIGSPVVLRHWQPGDRFQPLGLGFSVKLQDFFINENVPRQLRHQLVVAATAQDEIFWVEDLRISERFKLKKSTKRRLHWAWQRL
jgi:tRNA(Ile)-lysidine synthase